MTSPTWSAAQYSKFEDERIRPAVDLLASVPLRTVAYATDLGCGTGSSTGLVADRYPGAKIVGVDSSENMLASARERLPDIRFLAGDIATWRASQSQDLIFANAVMQWLPDHEILFPSLLEQLTSGGSLAIQMPDNLSEPSHMAMRAVAAAPRWAARMASALSSRSEILSAPDYYAMLRARCRRVDVWRTTYHHPMQGVSGIVDWFKGSGLRPFLDALTPTEQAEFLAMYEEELSKSYSTDASGASLLAFPRLFIIAVRA